MVRPATSGSTQHVQIQWLADGAPWRTLANVTVSGPSESFTVPVKPTSAGRLRFQWTSPSGNVFHSRPVAVS
jgi:hypothetical protein